MNRLVPAQYVSRGGHAHTADRTEILPVLPASATYREAGIDLVMLAGKNYGAGSSRDWAAKSQALPGVGAVVAESFERIHRSSLIGMGILPIVFTPGDSAAADHHLDGSETFTFDGLADLQVGINRIMLRITRPGQRDELVPVLLRLDTRNEIAYLRHGGTLPYVVRRGTLWRTCAMNTTAPHRCS